MTDFTGLMEIVRANLLKVDEDQIAEISELIKKTSSTGLTFVSYSEHIRNPLREATKKFLENEGFGSHVSILKYIKSAGGTKWGIVVRSIVKIWI